MVTHFIILSSSYSLGTRIGLDYVIDDVEVDREKLQKIMDQIFKECGSDVSTSSHMVRTENRTWKSVCEEDHYFKDVKLIKNVKVFIELIKQDRTLDGVDIAKYILSQVTCTQLKLQKLVYLCFADYLCSTGKELFTNKILAYQYGPVVDSVYKTYKKYKYEPISDSSKDIAKNENEMPSKSRILFAEDGLKKVQSIDATLKKYGNLTASKLVDLTHRENAPWSISNRENDFVKHEIKREIIKKYHCYEMI